MDDITLPSSKLFPSKELFLQTAVDVRQNPDEIDLAYMARELVQCTLPHRDPGEVPLWTRTNGNLTLVMARTIFNSQTQSPVGYPFGSIPRLLLFWMTTEALKTKSRRLELGNSYSDFLRELGFNPQTGRGKRGDAKRVRDQARRLFGASIRFQFSTPTAIGMRERAPSMPITSDYDLWWDPKSPDQMGMFDSWIELGETFYKTITKAPVPADMRVLRALKRSPLALDLYVWATHKALTAAKKGKPQFVPWAGLMKQFGSDYSELTNFQQNAVAALRKIKAVYPGLDLSSAYGGINILPSSCPSVPPRP